MRNGGHVRVKLYDEIDHLGAYLARNRFDMDVADRFSEGADHITLDGFSDAIDTFFASESWSDEPAPRQAFPLELVAVFDALELTGKQNWLRADSLVRDLGSATRERLAVFIREMTEGLQQAASRWFLIEGDTALAVWIDRDNTHVTESHVRQRLTAASIAAGRESVDGLRMTLNGRGEVIRAEHFHLLAPPHGTTHRNVLEGIAAELRAKKKAL